MGKVLNFRQRTKPSEKESLKIFSTPQEPTDIVKRRGEKNLRDYYELTTSDLSRIDAEMRRIGRDKPLDTDGTLSKHVEDLDKRRKELKEKRADILTHLQSEQVIEPDGRTSRKFSEEAFRRTQDWLTRKGHRR